jgi:putative transposase
MKTIKSFKYRIYPNQKQKDALEKHFGCVRFVYNTFLRKRIDTYAETKQGLTYHETAKSLTELKNNPDFVWLKEVNSQSLQYALRTLDTAYSNFFNKRSKFPKFKKKRNKQSFKVPQNYKLNDDLLTLPKIQNIKIKQHRELEGTPISVTISKTSSGKYYASFQCNTEIPEPEYTGSQVGVDFGLKDFVTTSDHLKIKHPKHLRKSLKSIKRLQRKVSRKVKGSNNRSKAIKALASKHEKVANQRFDFLHKLSHQMINENQVIVLEDLSLKNMVKNHRLALSLSDSGWSEFVRQLEYKGDWYGCHVRKVDRFFPSSKRCHKCGWINESLALKDRKWICLECGTTHDRDFNASINILNFGTDGKSETLTPGKSV